MVLIPRDQSRYGRYTAESNEGPVEIEISICGWFERITVWHNGIKTLFTTESDSDEDIPLFDETDTSFDFAGYDDYGSKLHIDKATMHRIS